MKTSVANKGNGEVTLTVELEAGEFSPYLARAATKLAQKTTIPGFRVGKAPIDIVKQRVGESALYEAAAEEAATIALSQALTKQTFSVFGKPVVRVEKLAPGNPFVFTAEVAVVPDVSLNKWEAIRIMHMPITVHEEDIEKLVEELRGMQAKEVLADRAARDGDKLEINFTVTRDGAPIEGGAGKKFSVVLGSKSMIPGFEAQLTGMKAGGVKDFELTFPTPYVEERLAGKQAQFHVEVIGVYDRMLPEKNDEWAQVVHGGTYAALLDRIRENLQSEKELAEVHRIENEVLDRILAQATIGDIPKRMTEVEVDKMLIELQDDVEGRGMEWEKYLQSIKKTLPELRAGFQEQAKRRVRAALVIREFSKLLAIQATAEEIAAEIARQKERYSDDTKLAESFSSKDFERYVGTIITNRKVMEALVGRLVR
ncbi:MAG: trigger factor [Candidatus Komeilibacteria bacterium RIFCSPHIGHO2_01_FULL_52_14]|uniref:Trigger factor n=1 Tax=Candidatus Komeilibacteria bacterium RIFCSPHIGHO2_01_FULL_52_14 TaxID=1798549 RepID=A0A1G2BK20_9BACT|nr:MAG: trigger factor [Candidatus Komeilibacteria bacterium RIFCSPHIGHO2_01_FULL_52_14]